MRMAVLKFILPIMAILSVFKCSKIVTIEEIDTEVAKAKLVRQTNSPTSQELLQELSRKLHLLKMNSVTGYSCEMGFEEAWTAYEYGDRGALIQCIRRGRFDPNNVDGGEKSLLIKAVLKGDFELVEEVLKLPGVNVNFMGNSGLFPIELAFSHPQIFDVLLASGADVLARDAFGSNPVRLALKEERIDLAEKMLKGVEGRNEVEREEIEKLEDRIRRMKKSKMPKKEKID